MEVEKRRYAGIDLGKREYTMAIIGKDGKMKVNHGKTSKPGRQALYRPLGKGDKVAPEAGNLAFIMAYEIKERLGCEVRVLSTVKLPFVWDAPTIYRLIANRTVIIEEVYGQLPYIQKIHRQTFKNLGCRRFINKRQ